MTKPKVGARSLIPKGLAESFIRLHVNSPHGDTDPCVLWPYGSDSVGYGKIRWGGRADRPHRVLLSLRDGPPPPGKPWACHGPCHNTLCVVHVSWNSVRSNILDRVRDGTHSRGERHGMSKLTGEQVLDIRNRRIKGEIRMSIANNYEVSVGTIRSIESGKSWAWL